MCLLTGMGFGDLQIELDQMKQSALHLQEKQMENFGEKPFQVDSHENLPHYFLSFDVLYWQPKVDRVEVSMDASRVDDAVKYDGATTQVISFDWSFGLKAGIGVCVPKTQWVLSAEYTRVQFETNYLFDSGSQRFLAPNFVSSFFVQQINGTYPISYQTVSLELHRDIFLRQDFAWQFGVGAKGAWINQLPQQKLGDNLWVNLSEKTRSLGPLFMMHTSWCFAGDWSLYTDSGVALLFAQYRGRIEVDPINQNFEDFESNNKETKHYVIPNAIAQLGLAYETEIGEEGISAVFKLGYEVQYYVRQSYQIVDVTAETWPMKGAFFSQNLAVYGLTASATCAF